MSGSIGGDRILRSQVQPTYNRYIQEVLKGFPGYNLSTITGSYNAGTKKDHGDIDLAVYIKSNKEVKDVKKDFKKYLDSLPDAVTVPFRTGRRQGEKSQIYGAIVTCQFPIFGEEGKYVQIDNIIVTTPQGMRFQKSFLDLDAAKQALVMGLVRVLPIRDDVLKKFELENLPELPKDQEYEFVLSPAGLSFRQVTLNDERKESSRVELWRSTDWDNVLYLLKGYDLSDDFETLLKRVDKDIKDKRSRERIVGIMKSMINVGVGEVGTPKGEAKQKAIDMAQNTLLESRMKNLNDYIIEAIANKDLYNAVIRSLKSADEETLKKIYGMLNSDQKKIFDFLKNREMGGFADSIINFFEQGGDLHNLNEYIDSISEDGISASDIINGTNMFELVNKGDIKFNIDVLKRLSKETGNHSPKWGAFECLLRVFTRNFTKGKGDVSVDGEDFELKGDGARLSGAATMPMGECLNKLWAGKYAGYGDLKQKIMTNPSFMAGSKKGLSDFWIELSKDPSLYEGISFDELFADVYTCQYKDFQKKHSSKYEEIKNFIDKNFKRLDIFSLIGAIYIICYSLYEGFDHIVIVSNESGEYTVISSDQNIEEIYNDVNKHIHIAVLASVKDNMFGKGPQIKYKK